MSASFPSRSGSWCWAAPIACGTSCAACARNPEDGAATRRGKLQAAGHQDMVDAGFFPGRALCGKPGPAVEPFGAALVVQLQLAVAAGTRALQHRVQYLPPPLRTAHGPVYRQATYAANAVLRGHARQQAAGGHGLPQAVVGDDMLRAGV